MASLDRWTVTYRYFTLSAAAYFSLSSTVPPRTSCPFIPITRPSNHLSFIFHSTAQTVRENVSSFSRKERGSFVKKKCFPREFSKAEEFRKARCELRLRAVYYVTVLIHTNRAVLLEGAKRTMEDFTLQLCEICQCNIYRYYTSFISNEALCMR